MDKDLGASYSRTELLAIEDQAPPCDPGALPRDDCPIGEMAREFGTTQRALRFYESLGLLAPRREGPARLYSRHDRQRLALLLKAKSLGFTLAEIRHMLAAPQQPHEPAGLSISRHQCFEQIRLLEQRKREIERALAELRHTYSSFYARIAGSGG